MPALEIGGLILLIATATISYLVISGRASPDEWLDPPIVAALLVANLVPAMAIMVLFARRIAKRREMDHYVFAGKSRKTVRRDVSRSSSR